MCITALPGPAFISSGHIIAVPLENLFMNHEFMMQTVTAYGSTSYRLEMSWEEMS